MSIFGRPGLEYGKRLMLAQVRAETGNERVVAAMEPTVMAEVVGGDVRAIAEEVSARIHRVFEAMD